MMIKLMTPISRRMLTTTTTTTSTCNRAMGIQILMSPSLASLDLLDTDHQWPSATSTAAATSVYTVGSNERRAGRVIDGKIIAEEIRSCIAAEVTRMKQTLGKVPGLGVVLVGHRKDSEIYVRNKIKACEEAGIKSLVTRLPLHSSHDCVVRAISDFNGDHSLNGVLVQLPLPEHLDEEQILNTVSLEKDVDGFHPLNIGNLAMMGREPLFISCTPKGCVELLIRSGVEIMGKNVAIIGRSNIVGLPTSLLLQRHHATVSCLHALSNNPEQITAEADIVITAAGVPNLVRGHWLKPGAVVIDVGTCPVEDPSCEQGYRLVGDVCYEEATKVASAITPVPGGVGPMTIAMLLFNTLDSAKRTYGLT